MLINQIMSAIYYITVRFSVVKIFYISAQSCFQIKYFLYTTQEEQEYFVTD